MASAGWRLPVRSGMPPSPSMNDAERAGQRDHRGVQHGHLDELPLPGPLAVQQGAQDAGEEMDAAQEVAHGAGPAFTGGRSGSRWRS